VADRFGKPRNSEGFEDLGSMCSGKRFCPTITDYKLLIGTKEWDGVKALEGIDENTVDEEEPDKKF
jgi:hypothetical protein